jgi:catechol 2,3-dioxygenase-like lactoylglutathione lyase family enzyme
MRSGFYSEGNFRAIFALNTDVGGTFQRMKIETLDHIALWVGDRDELADFLVDRLGMHVIDRTDKFTLAGSNARRGKLTLFTAEGPRGRGALRHIGLRVRDLEQASRGLPAGLAVDEEGGALLFDVAGGLRLGLVEGESEVDYDLDHAALHSEDPERTAEAYRRYGFAPARPSPAGVPRVEVGGAWIEFHEGSPGQPEKPLLNHLGVLVDSAEEHIAEADEVGIEIADIVDAPNTYAVFLWGPEGVKIEYVEHKASFSLV